MEICVGEGLSTGRTYETIEVENLFVDGAGLPAVDWPPATLALLSEEIEVVLLAK